MQFAQKMGLVALLSIPALASAEPMSPRDIYRAKAKAVVLVFATDGSAQGSAGTGSIITDDGQVITNAHVVAKNGTPYRRLFVYLKPDRLTGSTQKDLKHRFRAVLVDLDPDLDLALLRMQDPPEDLTRIDFADPMKVEIGEPVVALGHPETGGLWTLTTGTISSAVADFQGLSGKDVFQTDASVNRGNSGGPLLNAYGQMVGINTSISRLAADNLPITGINFSLQSSVAVDWMKRRQTLHLAYVEPPQEAAVGAPPTIAAAETPKARQKLTEKEILEGSEVQVSVVEPSKGREVAEDPEFLRESAGSTLVGRTEKRKPKQLTKSRPYRYESLVEEQMRQLEDMMDEMRGRIETKRKSRGFKKLGGSAMDELEEMGR